MTQQDNSKKVGAAIIPVDSEMQEIISVFVEEVNGYVQAINNAMSESDFRTIGRLGHTIKGDSLTVGLDDIAVIGASIENAAKSRDRDQIENSVSELANQMEQVVNSLK